MSLKRRVALVAKELLDRMVAAAALAVLAPVMVPVAVLVRLDSKGPVLFRQIREGRHGKPFSVYKFRSMVVDAEARAGGTVTRLDSSFVTPLGRFLRRSSLDELPQLFNVLYGDMSLVGPRPLLPGSVGVTEARRQSMKPGCTGLVVVRGRQLLSWEERMKLDLWYVDHWSLWLDVEILVKTIPAALSGRGVYDAQNETKIRTPIRFASPLPN